MIHRRVVLSTILLLATLASAHALTVLNRGNGSEPKSLDPAFVDTVAESNILGDILTGLTTLDAAARPIPGVAERWDIAKDGKTWTFHLRKSQWSDGHPVTAQDFVFAWQRELDPKTAAPYAYNLWVLKNARAISNGKMPPASLGVRAADNNTLVVQLEHPAAYLPELLTHDTAYPVPRHVMLAKGNAWARVENFTGNGAYMPAEWVLNDHITLKKNPRFYDAAHVRIDTVNYFPAEDSQSALNRLRARELDTQSPIPSTSIDWLRKNIPAALRTTPFLATSYFALNNAKPPLNDVRVRKAINLAFGREAVTDKVLKLGDRPAYGIVPPGVANFPGGAAMDFKAMPPPARIALAQSLMQQAGYGPGNRLRLTLETTHDPDNKRVAAVLQAMLRPVFIDIEIQQVDLQIHYRNMQIGNYEIASAVWIADFNDASNFLDLLRSDSGNNYARYHNRAYDTAMDAAQQEPDAAKRGQLLLNAEKIALKDYPWLPWRFRVTQDLVQPYVKGWIPNARDYNRTRWLWVETRSAALPQAELGGDNPRRSNKIEKTPNDGIDWSMWIEALGALATSVFTAVLAIATIRLWNSTKGLHDETKRLAELAGGQSVDMKASIEAATIAANAARKSADTAEKALVGLETPFLYPVFVEIGIDNHLQGFALYTDTPGLATPRLCFTIKNYGRTPALLKILRASFIFASELPDPLSPEIRTDFNRAPLLEVDKQMGSVFWCNCSPKMDRVRFNDFKSLESYFWFFGEVEFADIFGAKYTQTFCLVYLDATKGFVPWKESYNKRNRNAEENT